LLLRKARFKFLFSVNYLVSLKDIRTWAEFKFFVYAFILQIFHPHVMGQSLQDVFACYTLKISLKDFFLRQNYHFFYIEVGGSEPVVGSNSYLFEKLKCDGIIIEASTVSCNEIKKIRSCKVINQLLSNVVKSYDFVEFTGNSNGLSGIRTKLDDSTILNSKQYFIKKRLSTKLQTILNAENISHINFLSVDVEGHEKQVLEGIDFSKTQVDALTVEYNYDSAKKTELVEYLSQYGFKLFDTRLSRQDLWFASENI
jgi:FkbM family methyltransferase